MTKETLLDLVNCAMQDTLEGWTEDMEVQRCRDGCKVDIDSLKSPDGHQLVVTLTDGTKHTLRFDDAEAIARGERVAREVYEREYGETCPAEIPSDPISYDAFVQGALFGKYSL